MRYGYESPTYGDNFHFGHINMRRYVEAVESASDRKEAATSLAAVLARTYEQFIASETTFLARGPFVDHAHEGQERFETDAYGTILGFEPIFALEDWFTAVKMEVEKGPENVKYLLLSTKIGQRFSLVPDYHASSADRVLLNYWRKIAESQEKVEDFLFSVSSLLGNDMLAFDKEVNLQAVEEIMREHYGVRKFDYLSVTGSRARFFERPRYDEYIPASNMSAESSIAGDFEGLVFYDDTKQYGHKVLQQLCVALHLEEGNIVLQPCVNLQSLDSVAT